MTPHERLLAACRREDVDRPPVWMMRQAGRYLPPYRALRERYATLEMMKTPRLACEVTLQPVELIGVDAAILYSDILIVPEAMGMGLAFTNNNGPSLQPPIRDFGGVKKLDDHNILEKTGFVFATIDLIRNKLGTDFPLIGFAGAPHTVATYMIEGGSAKHFQHSRMMIRQDPLLFQALLEKIASATLAYLSEQVRHGANVIQLFDTWAGLLAPEDYKTFALPPTHKIIASLKTMGVPTILYCRGSNPLLEVLAQTGVDVVSVDWMTSLSAARDRLPTTALQGNLNPEILLGTPEQIQQGVEKMVQDWGGKPGYLMNLGHGILPETPVENAKMFVQWCQEYGSACQTCSPNS